MDILSAAGSIGLVLKKVSETNGGEYAGPCPACGGRDRFRVWPNKGGGGSYWCRDQGNGCGKGGDLVQFLVDFCQYDYKSAFQAVGREMPADYRPAAYRPQINSGPDKFEPRVYEDPVETWQKKAGELVEKAHGNLLQSEKIMNYLASRGLDYDAVKVFKLGWLPGEGDKNCMFRPRESWGLPTIKKENGRKKMLWIPRGIVIPYFKKDRVYRIRIRRPKPDLKTEKDIKYYVLPGSGMDAMVLYPVRKVFIVVEAELDGMVLARQAGAVAGVVALGSAQNKPGSELFYILKTALRILVALDYDHAGLGAWKWWRDEFDNAKQWPVPVGKDPGDAFQAGVDLLRWVMDGLPAAMKIKMPEPAPQPDPVPGPEPERVKGPDLPENVLKFKDLLDRYPFKVRATAARTTLKIPYNWHNHAIEREASRLMFYDPDVFEYLHSHQAEIIDRSNFLNFEGSV